MSLPALKDPQSPQAKDQQTPDLPEIITRYASGESMLDIAPHYGVSSRTLYRWLLTDLGDAKYQQLITDCLVYRIHDADQALHNAQDSCQVSRAREEARFSRMDFERRRPHLYGPKQEVKHTGVAPSLHISVVQAPQSGNVYSTDVSKPLIRKDE